MKRLWHGYEKLFGFIGAVIAAAELAFLPLLAFLIGCSLRADILMPTARAVATPGLIRRRPRRP